MRLKTAGTVVRALLTLMINDRSWLQFFFKKKRWR
jgi:hypothetical protein